MRFGESTSSHAGDSPGLCIHQYHRVEVPRSQRRGHGYSEHRGGCRRDHQAQLVHHMTGDVATIHHYLQGLVYAQVCLVEFNTHKRSIHKVDSMGISPVIVLASIKLCLMTFIIIPDLSTSLICALTSCSILLRQT